MYAQKTRDDPQVLIFIGGNIGTLFHQSLDHKLIITIHGL
jgi:hypothetical protein